jgi:large subunit ribosomal protein L21
MSQLEKNVSNTSSFRTLTAVATGTAFTGIRPVSYTSVITPSPASTFRVTLRPKELHHNSYSTTASTSRYAVIDHSEAYETAMNGRHGKQLALAKLEGIGKDNPPFDPFLEEELLSGKMMADEKTSNNIDDEDRDADDGYDADVSEDEYDDEEFADGVDDEELLSPYNPDGSVRRKKSVLATLRAGYPAGGLFAVFELGGSQHKVTTDDLVVVNRLKPIDTYKIGSVHTLKDILLVGSSHHTLVGLPYVNGAEVDVMVEEITRDAKVIVFKKRRRKNSQRKNGFRRDLTLLRVLDVRFPNEQKDYFYVSRDNVDDLDAHNHTSKTVIVSNPATNKKQKSKEAAAATHEEEELKSA